MHSLPPAIDIFLQPGEYFVGDADYRMRTLLGSCVSITLWHGGSRIGAMSHFLLADRGTGAPGELDGRYGDEAMTLMTQGLAQVGVRAQECQAKLFGGGNMFPGLALAGQISVGRNNGQAARQIVQSLGIRVVSESLFGFGHRNLVFDVRTGDVWVRRSELKGGPE
ncbi:MAG TPA: chemotaxis protein CheD [Polyangia bacterium]|nr:chemotaxis protein CheD [Polyangia bacterium]